MRAPLRFAILAPGQSVYVGQYGGPFWCIASLRDHGSAKNVKQTADGKRLMEMMRKSSETLVLHVLRFMM